MKFNEKTDKYSSQYQHDLASNQVSTIKKDGSSSLWATLLKFKKAKQISNMREDSFFSKSGKQIKNQQISELGNLNQEFFNLEVLQLTKEQVSNAKRQTQNYKITQNHQNTQNYKEIQDRKNEFKEFPNKIQKNNKGKLMSQMCLKSQAIKNDARQECHSKAVQLISKHRKIIQDYSSKFPLKIISGQQGSKGSQQNPFPQSRRKLIIHESANKSFLNRSYGRSKTQQQINKQMGDQRGNASKQSSFRKEQNEHRKSKEHRFNLFYIQKIGVLNNHLSLKLMQKEKVLEIYGRSKQQMNHDLSLVPSVTNDRSGQEDVAYANLKINRPKKMRIRLGSSIYNKNVSSIEQNYCNQKESFFTSHIQTISSEDLAQPQNYKKGQRKSHNSIFCQNKILQARQAFIQKRRLLPTAGQSRKDLIKMKKMKKRYFTILNSSKKDEKCKNNSTTLEKNNGQKLNGWQVNNYE